MGEVGSSAAFVLLALANSPWWHSGIATFCCHLLGTGVFGGCRFGPAHTEVILTPDGPRVVDSQTRIGGDRAAARLLIVGRKTETLRMAKSFGLNVILFQRKSSLQPEQAKLSESISGIEKLSEREEVIAVQVSTKPGDVVRPLQNNWDRLGLVAVAGPDSDAAVRLCGDLIDRSVSVQMSRD
jgi:L-amino acid ligase C-terminal domain 2